MKPIADQIKDIPAESAILDGEVVVLAENGTTSFADLQAAFQEGIKKPVTYFAFDLLHLNGHNLRGLSLVDRKALLAQLLEKTGNLLRFSEHLETTGEAMFHKACEFHAEGIISKRAASKYFSGRSRDWLKLAARSGMMVLSTPMTDDDIGDIAAAAKGAIQAVAERHLTHSRA